MWQPATAGGPERSHATGGIPAVTPDPPADLPDVFDAVERYGEELGPKVFLRSVDQRRTLSYAELRSFCRRISACYGALGIGEADKVSVIGANSAETLLIFLGTLYHGAVINPINVDESRANVYKILGLVKPRLVLHDAVLALDAKRLAGAERRPFTNFEVALGSRSDFFSALPPASAESAPAARREGDLAEVLFTSGTTSTPKGVCIARGPLHAMVSEIAEKMGITGDDVLLEYRNYNWASAQLLTILSSVLKGATLVLARKFSRSRFPRWLAECGVTIAAGVPTVINILAHEPVCVQDGGLGRVRFMTSSSAPLSVASQLEFERIYGIPIVQAMGMSEAGFMLGNPFEGRKTGSAGTPCKYKEIFFVGPGGRRCGPGEEGEMVVRGYAMGMGYLEEDGRIAPFPAEGFRTGDLGYTDADGFIYITGRAKDLIIRGGVNIAPMEITSRIMEHPSIREAATIGVPDPIYGEEVASFVVAKEGCGLRGEDVIAHCRKSLPDFKVPKSVHLLDEIPKNDRGKVSKHDLLQVFHAKLRNP
ncbi:MAG: AMP-binding protein [Deltaproteobacteria bacterium]|nr:AMP-binding protein [Deltaproteobacteria bacterium]